MCRNCNCTEQKSNCFETCCEKTKACDNKYSTSCIFYKLENQSNSRLHTIKAENGTPLNTILEEFDKKLNNTSAPDFTAFKIPYLKSKYNVVTIKQFSEAVSGELFKIDDKNKSQQINIDALEIATTTNTNEISKLKYPQITDSAAAGFTVYSDVKTVLQKITDKLSTLTVSGVTSPSINSIETSSIKFVLEGTLNHTIRANVKVSGQAGNSLQIVNDGLFVPIPTISSSYQTISLNGNQLSLTNGGVVTLPTSTLTLTGTQLGIVGSAVTVNLASVLTNSQQAISTNNSTSISISPSGTLGHTLTATLIKSGDVGNALEIRTTGVFVGKTTAQEVLDEINLSVANSSLRNTFCTIQNTTCKPPYRFYVKNISNASISFSFVNKDTGTSTITLASGASSILLGVERITYSDLDKVDIKFLGV